MTPYDFCAQQAAQPGSALYYACRRLPERPRTVLIALHALAAELRCAVAIAISPEIAFARLHWWQEELLRLPGPAAQHPISRALQPHLERSGLAPAELLPLIAPCLEDLERPRPATQAALVSYATRTGGYLHRLAARIDQPMASDHTLALAERLGTGCALVDVLRDVGADARAGRIRLPVDALQKYRVRVQELLDQSIGPTDSRFEALMRSHAALASDYLSAMAPTVNEQRQVTPTVTAATNRVARLGVRAGLGRLAAIKRALLEEITVAPGDVLIGQISLTPLRMLWLTWRNRGARTL